MERIYRLFGLAPDVIGSIGSGANRIGVGLWEMKQSAWPDVLRKAGVCRDTSKKWFDTSFGSTLRPVEKMPEFA
jgi:acyl homoserine lactone synthase